MGQSIHSFHIPVMGLAFTIDSPIKVAKYGISSVVSLGDDVLIEDMRRHYSQVYGIPFEPIEKFEEDYRARRITGYLNLLDDIIQEQFLELQEAPLDMPSELTKYIDMLDEGNGIKQLYTHYLNTENEEIKANLEEQIRREIAPGTIDVNIMSKLDAAEHDKHGELLPAEYSSASAGLRGYANSRIQSSLILSAGFNPRLYGYISAFPDFFPDDNGLIKKKVVLKVSDFRSARIQGQYMAKKGIFISEFRIESGLNCGGHAFPTEGYLLGPILEEFKTKKEELTNEMIALCSKIWDAKGIPASEVKHEIRVTVQGGIGTAKENKFLLDYYKVSSTGWGTPFLLVPEATTLDAATLNDLSHATPDQLYLSEASPLGIPFNNFSMSASEILRKKRIAQGRPGSPCLKKYLVSNTEFTKEPICTASRQYMHHKLKELDEKHLPEPEYQAAFNSITAKECLCEDLSAPAYINSHLKSKLPPATAVCPGPNLAFFSGIFSLKQMVDHIYGRTDLLNTTYRPNMFVNELKLYIDYLKKEVNKHLDNASTKQVTYFANFMKNLEEGIDYYKTLIPKIKIETPQYLKNMMHDLANMEAALFEIRIPELVPA